MLSLGMLSHQMRRGRILAGCLLLHLISKEGFKSSSKMIVIPLKCCQKSHNISSSAMLATADMVMCTWIQGYIYFKTQRGLYRLDFQYSGQRGFLFFCYNNATFNPLNLTLAFHSHDSLTPQECLLWIKSMVVVIHCCVITRICARCSRGRYQLFWTWD